MYGKQNMKGGRLPGDVTHEKACNWAHQKWAVARTKFKWALSIWSRCGPRFGLLVGLQNGLKFGQDWARARVRAQLKQQK